MKKWLWIALVCIVGFSGTYFIITALRNSAEPPQPGAPPVADEAPARVYGMVEPSGREVFVSAPNARRVVEVKVREGDEVARGQVLCVLDHDVEEKAVAVARARIAEAKGKLALSEEELRRNRNLYAENALRGSDVTDGELLVAYEKGQIAVAEAEAALEEARLDDLFLRSPIDGIVYKFDVRLGETLSPGDNAKIVLGSPKRQVRLFVEVFWRGRVTPGARYDIKNSESGERVGTGTVVSAAPYLGRRDFRTEDSQERFDTKYQEVVLELDTGGLPEPQIGLSVMAELGR